MRVAAALLHARLCLGAWYDGIDSIKVLNASESSAVDWASLYESRRQAQFDDERLAILLTSGSHDVEIGLGYYMSLHGVAKSRSDVSLRAFYALDLYDDGSGGGATQNFWRSVEGVTTTNSTMTWATSQACPIRRSHVQGNLHLSVKSSVPGTHWSSGGFLGDTQVDGSLYCGTQQQFMFRNDNFLSGTKCANLANGAFVGSTGQDASEHVSEVPQTPDVAEKPFLVEDNGEWFIAVPPRTSGSSGTSADAVQEMISFSDVYVARAGDGAAAINAAIAGKRALLLTPGIYNLQGSIEVSQNDFVVLGLGFATLVAHTTAPALHVTGQAVRVAAVLFEAGSTSMGTETQPLLNWEGPSGIGSDIFSRVGAFPGRSCALTRADVHVRVAGQGTLLDNTWMWHADHDDCGGVSDSCVDAHGLVVDANDTVVYGLKAEHMFDDHVLWNGENGQAFFFQCELPYHQPNFGTSGKVGYHVADHVQQHHGVALGVYIVFDQLQHGTAFRAPASAGFENLLAWCITGAVTQFDNLLCEGNSSNCQLGSCSYNQCRLASASTIPSILQV
jgi:hypothetical protein